MVPTLLSISTFDLRDLRKARSDRSGPAEPAFAGINSSFSTSSFMMLLLLLLLVLLLVSDVDDIDNFGFKVSSCAAAEAAALNLAFSSYASLSHLEEDEIYDVGDHHQQQQ